MKSSGPSGRSAGDKAHRVKNNCASQKATASWGPSRQLEPPVQVLPHLLVGHLQKIRTIWRHEFSESVLRASWSQSSAVTQGPREIGWLASCRPRLAPGAVQWSKTTANLQGPHPSKCEPGNAQTAAKSCCVRCSIPSHTRSLSCGEGHSPRCTLPWTHLH